jgi:hypothetical protein
MYSCFFPRPAAVIEATGRYRSSATSALQDSKPLTRIAAGTFRFADEFPEYRDLKQLEGDSPARTCDQAHKTSRFDQVYTASSLVAINHWGLVRWRTQITASPRCSERDFSQCLT